MASYDGVLFTSLLSLSSLVTPIRIYESYKCLWLFSYDFCGEFTWWQQHRWIRVSSLVIGPVCQASSIPSQRLLGFIKSIFITFESFILSTKLFLKSTCYAYIGAFCNKMTRFFCEKSPKMKPILYVVCPIEYLTVCMYFFGTVWPIFFVKNSWKLSNPKLQHP
jgi:hypothetical protein